MSDKSKSANFKQIMQEGKALLEAAIINDFLRFRLIISESADINNVYIGEIRNFEDHMKLKECFNSFYEVFESLKDSKNVKLSLEDLSIILVDQANQKNSELIKVLFKLEEDISEPVSLSDIIDKCSQKEDLLNDKIKKNFEVLAKEICELKQQRKIERFQSLKQQILGTISKEVQKIKDKQIGFEQTHLKQIYELRKEIKKIQNFEQAIPFKVLEKVVENNNQKITSSFKKNIDQFNKQIKILNDQLNKNIQNVKNSTENPTNNSIEPQQKHLKLYKQNIWSNEFNFDGKTLIKISDDPSGHIFAFLQEIKFDRQYKISFKITKSKNKNIFIGL